MTAKDQVKQNLLFYTLWTDVTEVRIANEVILRGIPKEPLLNDESDAQSENEKEYVLPVYLSEKLTPTRLEAVFCGLQEELGSRPKRLVAGIVNDDSTVVYYFIHDGVYKPKKN